MKKNVNTHDLQIIEEVSNTLQVAPAVVEKDLFVTQALHALAEIEDTYFQLVFQGGTCLSKAYQLIQRMSEDCDFRIAASDIVKSLSKTEFRRRLRNFRNKILNALEEGGFIIDPKQINVGNGGQYMDMYLDYDTKFPASAALRSQVKLEFIAINTKIPAALKVIPALFNKT